MLENVQYDNGRYDKQQPILDEGSREEGGGGGGSNVTYRYGARLTVNFVDSSGNPVRVGNITCSAIAPGASPQNVYTSSNVRTSFTTNPIWSNRANAVATFTVTYGFGHDERVEYVSTSTTNGTSNTETITITVIKENDGIILPSIYRPFYTVSTLVIDKNNKVDSFNYGISNGISIREVINDETYYFLGDGTLKIDKTDYNITTGVIDNSSNNNVQEVEFLFTNFTLDRWNSTSPTNSMFVSPGAIDGVYTIALFSSKAQVCVGRYIVQGSNVVNFELIGPDKIGEYREIMEDFTTNFYQQEIVARLIVEFGNGVSEYYIQAGTMGSVGYKYAPYAGLSGLAVSFPYSRRNDNGSTTTETTIDRLYRKTNEFFENTSIKGNKTDFDSLTIDLKRPHDFSFSVKEGVPRDSGYVAEERRAECYGVKFYEDLTIQGKKVVVKGDSSPGVRYFAVPFGGNMKLNGQPYKRSKEELLKIIKNINVQHYPQGGVIEDCWESIHTFPFLPIFGELLWSNNFDANTGTVSIEGSTWMNFIDPNDATLIGVYDAYTALDGAALSENLTDYTAEVTKHNVMVKRHTDIMSIVKIYN